MDIFAHALWAAAAAAALRPKFKQPIRVGWCVVWRVFPDFASFVIPALVRLGRWVTGASTTLLPDDGVRVSIGCGRSTTATRSAAVFTLIFGALCLVLRRPPLEMLGWALRRQIPVAT